MGNISMLVTSAACENEQHKKFRGELEKELNLTLPSQKNFFVKDIEAVIKKTSQDYSIEAKEVEKKYSWCCSFYKEGNYITEFSAFPSKKESPIEVLFLGKIHHDALFQIQFSLALVKKVGNLVFYSDLGEMLYLTKDTQEEDFFIWWNKTFQGTIDWREKVIKTNLNNGKI